jgi:hypothetical protein
MGYLLIIALFFIVAILLHDILSAKKAYKDGYIDGYFSGFIEGLSDGIVYMSKDKEK